MKYYAMMSIAALALAGCTQTVPDSGAPNPGVGVGFGSYEEYQKQSAARDAQLSGATPQTVVPPAQPVNQQSLGAADAGVAAEATAVLDATRPTGATPSATRPAAVTNAAGISAENDFTRVGEQRTIEDDAARREALKAQYQVVQPTAVPTRAGSTGPNIVEYALSTSHPKGQGLYRRTGINLQAKYTRNCAKYPSPDLAQAEFLKKGGPKRDRLSLDPDGDGYACSWDPAPFRAAKNAPTVQPVEIVETVPTE